MLKNDIEKHTQQVALTQSMVDVTVMFFEEQSSEMNEKEKQMLDGVKKSYIEHFYPVIKSMQDENNRKKIILGRLQQERQKQFQLLQNLSRSFMAKDPEVSEVSEVSKVSKGPQGPEVSEVSDVSKGPQGVEVSQGPQGPQGLEVSKGPQGHRARTVEILVYVIKDFGWSFASTLNQVITSVQQQKRSGSSVRLNQEKDNSFVYCLFRGVEEEYQITYVIHFLTNSRKEKIRIRINISQDEYVKSEMIRRLNAKCFTIPF